eukprot:3773298-Prymnesium_polylepis.1
MPRTRLESCPVPGAGRAGARARGVGMGGARVAPPARCHGPRPIQPYILRRSGASPASSPSRLSPDVLRAQ